MPSRRPWRADRAITTASVPPLLSLRPLFGHRIKRGVHRLDEVALQNGDLVVASVEYDDYLNCAVVRGVIEQHAGSRVSEHTRVGLHDRADLVDCRIKLDPWSDRVELVDIKPIPLLNAGEKMPFEVTPFYPYMKRIPIPHKPLSAKTDAPVDLGP